MKADRFSTAVLWAGLLLMAALPAAGQIRIQLPGISFESHSKKLAKVLAQQVGMVRKNFDLKRQALRTVPGPGGIPAHLRQEVTGLIASTEKELDQAIGQIGEPGLAALRAWSAEEFRRIREEAAAVQGQAASLRSGFSTPRAAALLASLGVSVSPGVPKEETIPTEISNRLLDQVGEVVSRIFFLAESNELEVKLWFGSTPASKAEISFWPQGRIKGTTPKQNTLRTNDRKSILRGLYDYSAAWKQGSVTQLVQHPSPAGVPAARQPGERLDLVNGTRFFCCDFDGSFCRHVDHEKDCRP